MSYMLLTNVAELYVYIFTMNGILEEVFCLYRNQWCKRGGREGAQPPSSANILEIIT